MEKHRQKIEENAVMMERMGFTPVASRIFVYLLFCDEKGVPFDELVKYFTVSKSAVSNALKMLTTTGMVSSRTIGGQRKRYFYSDMQAFFNDQYMSRRITEFLQVLSNIKKARGRKDTFDKKLSNIALLYKMMLAEFPIIIQRWKNTIELEQ